MDDSCESDSELVSKLNVTFLLITSSVQLVLFLGLSEILLYILWKTTDWKTNSSSGQIHAQS